MMTTKDNKRKIEEKLMFDNAPIESDDYETEAQVLDAQIKKEGVTNIGIVAPYGAGKSSAITTYLKRYRQKSLCAPKHVQISLADFNTDEKEISGNSNSYSENAIERSILQQLLYSQKKHALPKSSVNRTNKTNIFIKLAFAFLAIILSLSIIVLAFEVNGKNIIAWLTTDGSIIEATSSCVIAVSIIVLIFYLWHSGILRKVKYKDFEINVDGKGEVPKDYSLFNNFINEVLYFFECVNVDLVIFEDLDRLENLQIFVKLRELNTIINNSPKRANKVTFIYAVKDSMFKDEKQRAKFFEFILPIVPVINPITTYDSIAQMHQQQINIDSSLKLSDQFIKDISFFVSDMRVLKNTFNDYVVMATKLSDNNERHLSVKRENLFALALYKNLFPYDYSRLQNNEGLIPLCVDKEKVVDLFKEIEEAKIKELEVEKERIEKENLKDFNDLKLLFKGQHVGLAHLSNRWGAVSVDSIDSFKDVMYLQHPNPVYAGYAVQVQKLPSGETYYERETIIKNKGLKRCEEIETAIRVCKNKIEKIESQRFDVLIREYGIEQYFSTKNLLELKKKYKEQIANEIFVGKSNEDLPTEEQDKKLDAQIHFVRMLINKNYLDEDYLEYISNNKSNISAHDRDFIRNVKQGYVKSYNYKLDNVKAVLRNLNEEDFLQPAILIGDVCLSLDIIREIDDENDVKTHKFDNIMRLFASGHKNVATAVVEFLAVTDVARKEIFADYIAQFSDSIVEELFKENITNADKDIIIKALLNYKKYSALQLSNTRSYIENHSQYLTLLGNLDFDEACQLISRLNLVFIKLDVSNGKDKLYQFIVDGGHYSITVDNLTVVLDIKEEIRFEFEHKNYTYIQEHGDEKLKQQISNNLQVYINEVYTKLPDTNESESVVKAFLSNANLSDEIKCKLINHTDIRLTTLHDIDVRFYDLLLSLNKVVPSWDNIFIAYSAIKYGDSLIYFILQNDGKISGSFADQDKALQVTLFNQLIESKFEDDVFDSLAKSVNAAFAMNNVYAKNANSKYFVLAGCFQYNVQDMSILSNTPCMFPYLICHQDKIILEMKTFFGITTFASSYGKRVIEEKNLSINFKKEFWYNCSNAFENFNGIENELAKFLVRNGCKLTERLLYRFTDIQIESPLKMGLLSLAVSQGIVKNLQEFKTYFQSISEECSKLWNVSQKIVVEDDGATRLVVDYMKKSNLVSYTARKGKLHLKCS